MTEITSGTVDKPVAGTVPIEHYIDKNGGFPSLIIDVKLEALGLDGKWQFDGILHIDEGTITLLCHPADDDEGWHRLDDVGEW